MTAARCAELFALLRRGAAGRGVFGGLAHYPPLLDPERFGLWLCAVLLPPTALQQCGATARSSDPPPIERAASCPGRRWRCSARASAPPARRRRLEWLHSRDTAQRLAFVQQMMEGSLSLAQPQPNADGEFAAY